MNVCTYFDTCPVVIVLGSVLPALSGRDCAVRSVWCLVWVFVWCMYVRVCMWCVRDVCSVSMYMCVHPCVHILV